MYADYCLITSSNLQEVTCTYRERHQLASGTWSPSLEAGKRIASISDHNLCLVYLRSHASYQKLLAGAVLIYSI